MEKSLWSHISLVYRPIEVLFTVSLFTVSFPGFEELHADI